MNSRYGSKGENKSVTHRGLFALQAVQMQTGNVTGAEEIYAGFNLSPMFGGYIFVGGGEESIFISTNTAQHM